MSLKEVVYYCFSIFLAELVLLFITNTPWFQKGPELNSGLEVAISQIFPQTGDKITNYNLTSKISVEKFSKLRMLFYEIKKSEF